MQLTNRLLMQLCYCNVSVNRMTMSKTLETSKTEILTY